ncbi:hypothetical protein OROMI_031226 [Orobanche minor]
MPRRVKEDERVEMIVRGLLKEPENRRCINCNSLGPQYVCTTFWTFVCTICSGVQCREFTHRVKSVSMAKFSEEEITALQAGGNERAREIYFKAWDPQRNFYPDGSNLQRLREFVKHVYIDRKYAGENKQLSMIKLDSKTNYERRSYDKNNFFERHLPEKSSSSNNRDIDLTGSSSFEQSSPFNRNGGGITFRDIVEERRSPRNSQELAKSSSQRNRPATATRFEIVDDRFRDDGTVKRYDHRHSSRESRGGSRSPVSQTGGPTNLPSVRPIKEILGEKVPALKFGGPPKFNEQEEDGVNEGSATSQKVNRKQTETVNPSSLIDFDAQPEPTNNNESISIASADTKTAPDGPDINSLGSLLLDVLDTSQSNGSKAIERATYVENVLNDRLLEDSNKELTVQVTKQNETSLSPLGNTTSSNAQQVREILVMFSL